MHLSLWAVRYYGLKTEYVLYSAVATPTFGMGSAYFFHIAGMATVAGDRDDAIFLFESVVRGHHPCALIKVWLIPTMRCALIKKCALNIRMRLLT